MQSKVDVLALDTKAAVGKTQKYIPSKGGGCHVFRVKEGRRVERK